MEYTICDKCSHEVEETDVVDGPEGSEWESCSLCPICSQQVEDSDE